MNGGESFAAALSRKTTSIIDGNRSFAVQKHVSGRPDFAIRETGPTDTIKVAVIAMYEKQDVQMVVAAETAADLDALAAHHPVILKRKSEKAAALGLTSDTSDEDTRRAAFLSKTGSALVDRPIYCSYHRGPQAAAMGAYFSEGDRRWIAPKGTELESFARGDML
jgi:hypothetical protein